MEVLALLLLGVGGVPLSMYANSWIANRRFAAVWRGHRVLLQQHRGRTKLWVDHQLEADFPYIPFQNRLRQEWSHPALGETEIVIRRLSDEMVFVLQIGDEMVPLMEVSSMEKDTREDPWAVLLPGQQSKLRDPRWLAVCQLLQLIRQAPSVREEVLEAANLLQVSLRKHFEALRRLSSSEEVLEPALGMEEVKQRVEEKLAAGLAAAQQLHLAVVSLESHQDDGGALEQVNTTLERLQVETEVEQLLSQERGKSISDKKSQKAKALASLSDRQ